MAFVRAIARCLPSIRNRCNSTQCGTKTLRPAARGRARQPAGRRCRLIMRRHARPHLARGVAELEAVLVLPSGLKQVLYTAAAARCNIGNRAAGVRPGRLRRQPASFGCCARPPRHGCRPLAVCSHSRHGPVHWCAQAPCVSAGGLVGGFGWAWAWGGVGRRLRVVGCCFPSSASHEAPYYMCPPHSGPYQLYDTWVSVCGGFNSFLRPQGQETSCSGCSCGYGRGLVAKSWD